MFVHCQPVSTTHPRTGLRVVLVTRGRERWNRIFDYTTWNCGQHSAPLI